MATLLDKNRNIRRPGTFYFLSLHLLLDCFQAQFLPIDILIKITRGLFYIFVIVCHSLQVQVSTVDSYLVQNCFSPLLEWDYCASSTLGISQNINAW